MVVPNVFPSNSQCFLQDVLNNTKLLSHKLCPKLSSFSPIDIAGPIRRHSIFLYKIFLSLGSLQSVNLYIFFKKNLRCNPIKLIQRWIINNYPRNNPEKRAMIPIRRKTSRTCLRGRTIMKYNKIMSKVRLLGGASFGIIGHQMSIWLGMKFYKTK